MKTKKINQLDEFQCLVLREFNAAHEGEFLALLFSERRQACS